MGPDMVLTPRGYMYYLPIKVKGNVCVFPFRVYDNHFRLGV
mgnify:CR=1 FL=1